MTEQITFKERQKINKAPLQFALFKGVTGKFGALRLNLKKAYTDNRRDKDDGCVFLEMAPPIGNNVYDWENGKIIMALNITDISKIMLYFRSPNNKVFKDGKLNIYHDKGAGTANKDKNVTTLSISKPAGYDNFFFSLYQKVYQSNNREAKITVSDDEAASIVTLLQTALPILLAWNGWMIDESLHEKLDRIESMLNKALNH